MGFIEGGEGITELELLEDIEPSGSVHITHKSRPTNLLASLCFVRKNIKTVNFWYERQFSTHESISIRSVKQFT